MKLVQLICISCFYLFFSQSCTHTSNNKIAQDYEYIPLEKYSFEKADIKPGTRLKLLAFSGGNANDKEHTYYYQFIALDETTGDTLRILTPLISFDSPDAPNTFTTPLQFDAAKGITSATYELYDSSNIAMQLMSIPANEPDSAITSALNKERKSVEYVVSNKSYYFFENPHYKTAIGVLHFNEVPW